MPFADLNKPLVPDFDILVGGRPLPIEAQAHIVEVVVEDSVSLPSMFSFEIKGSDDVKNKFRWVDDTKLFALGAAVKIKFGYGDKFENVFSGELTGLEPYFAGGGRPGLVVRGYDLRHRLQRGRRTRTFVGQKDSQIVSTVASGAGLSARVTDSSVVHDYVVQANQTDWEFLQERARRIRFEVVIEDKNLIFRPPPDDAGAAFTMTPDDHLLDFAPRLSGARQVDTVSLRMWNPAGKEGLVGEALEYDVSSNLGGQKSGPKLAKDAFGAAAGTLTAYPMASQPEAEQVAKAQLNDLALSFIEGDGTCLGRTDLRAGKVIKIDGIGQRFGGLYYVTEAVHRFSSTEGYTTRFTVRRNTS